MASLMAASRDAMLKLSMSLLQMNVLPDFLLRWGVRKLLEGRLKELAQPTIEAQMKEIMAFVQCKFLDLFLCVRLCSLMRPRHSVSCFACLTRARKVLCVAFLCGHAGDFNVRS